MASPPVRVLVADDHPLYREGLLRAIGAREDLEPVGAAGDGREALEEIRRLAPDVAVLDVRMPGLEGPEVLASVRAEGLATKVILLSAQLDSETVYSVVAAGAQGYLSKYAEADEICDAIAAADRGETVLATEVQSALATQIQREAEASRGPSLSEREGQVLRLIAEGCSTPQIGARLHLSPATVKTHLQNLYEKLGVSDRASAVAEGMRRGLIE